MYLSIDIETSGPCFINNGIIAIGYCIGDENGFTLVKNRIHMKLHTDHSFDDDCERNFWNKNENLLTEFKKNEQSPKKGISKFIKVVDDLDLKYDNLIILCDNPSFDVGFLNFYISSYLKRRPLNFKFGNDVYRPVIDTNSFIKGVIGRNIYQFKRYIAIKNKLKYDHLPDNDAEVNLSCYIESRKMKSYHFNNNNCPFIKNEI